MKISVKTFENMTRWLYSGVIFALSLSLSLSLNSGIIERPVFRSFRAPQEFLRGFLAFFSAT